MKIIIEGKQGEGKSVLATAVALALAAEGLKIELKEDYYASEVLAYDVLELIEGKIEIETRQV